MARTLAEQPAEAGRPEPAADPTWPPTGPTEGPGLRRKKAEHPGHGRRCIEHDAAWLRLASDDQCGSLRAVGRIWLVRSYGEFEVAPEEVGLDQAAILVRVVPALAALAAVPLLLAIYLLLLAGSRWMMGGTPEDRTDRASMAAAPWLGVVAALVFLAIAAVQLAGLPDRAAEGLEEGADQPSFLVRLLFPVESPCVLARWIEPRQHLTTLAPAGEVVLHLGQPSGTTVLLRLNQGAHGGEDGLEGSTSLRVPTSQVVLEGRPESACVPSHGSG